MIDIKRLKDIREDHDMTQAEMASILGVTRPAYSLWELGISIIPLPNLCDFADYFGYSLDYILGLSSNRSKKNLKKGFSLQTLGNNLKTIRKKEKLSQVELAHILGVTQACIVRYEKGLICISLSNLYKFCQKFSISLNEVCGKGKI